MKLSISNSGIYEPIKNDLEDALSNLRDAKSTLTRPPASFSQSGYMSGVPSKISDLIRKVTSLSNACSRIDNKYRDFISDKKSKFNNLDDYTLKERIGLSEQFQMSSSKYNVNSEIFLNENGILTFASIAGATGIKSALPGNGGGVANDTPENGTVSTEPTPTVTDNTTPSSEQEKSTETELPPEKPEVMNMTSDAPAPTSGSSVPGAHSPGTMENTFAAQSYNLSPEEYRVLCATVYAEAAEGNEYTYSDTMGVTSAILNRVEAGNYGGSTVTEVVSAPNQFEGYGYGNQKFSRAMEDINNIPPDMMQAINDTLAGKRNTQGHSFVGNGTYNSFR